MARYRYSLDRLTERVDKTDLNKLFKALRARGLFARQNYLCCQGCARADLTDKAKPGQGYVFYHRQDAEDIHKEYGVLTSGMFLAYGLNDDGDDSAERVERVKVVANAIVEEAKKLGIVAEWDGDITVRVFIAPFKLPKVEVELNAVRAALYAHYA